jgi:hypothetical protein
MSSTGKPSRWREVAWASVASLAAVVVYYACQTPEPARTGLELVAAVCDASASSLAPLIEQHVAARFELQDGEHEPRSFTRNDLSLALVELRATWPTCQLDLEDWQVRASGSGTTWLEGTLVHSKSQASDLHARRRSVRALFRDAGAEGRGPWLERVILAPVARHEPEARP